MQGYNRSLAFVRALVYSLVRVVLCVACAAKDPVATSILKAVAVILSLFHLVTLWVGRPRKRKRRKPRKRR